MRKTLFLVFLVALMPPVAFLFARSMVHPNVYSVIRGAGIAVTFIALGSYLVWGDFLKAGRGLSGRGNPAIEGQEYRSAFRLYSKDGKRVADVLQFRNGETYLN